MFDEEREVIKSEEEKANKYLNSLTSDLNLLLERITEIKTLISGSEKVKDAKENLRNVWSIVVAVELTIFFVTFSLLGGFSLFVDGFKAVILFLGLGAFLGVWLSLEDLLTMLCNSKLSDEELENLEVELEKSKERRKLLEKDIRDLKEAIREYQEDISFIDVLPKKLGKIIGVKENEILDDKVRSEMIKEFDNFVNEKVDYSNVHFSSDFDNNHVKKLEKK